ncbi:hypothetical protein LSTR_LSTR003008 [Laodelphax striatellus]|uniref:Carboxylesterase type B domain-containing protein n=1 Tax=Laodelphax striatellus TaxID=195883 RepID=A0A482XSG1_LAOST|nr:hypothetical protein LSTR_LSTR003008 [Laodelphax striatellus]
MLSQHLFLLWLCVVVVLLTSPGVNCKRKKKKFREGDLTDDEVYQEVMNATSRYVTTDAGRFIGKLYMGNNHEWYHSFAEIPYAKAPTGHLRYKKPEPIPKDKFGENVYDVSKSINYEETSTRCMQYVRWHGHARNAEDVIRGTEDCLLLDVIRPAGLEIEHRWRSAVDILGLSKHANVLVLLHPGTFMYDVPMNHYQIAEYLCCNYLIFVFVRFRLGPLGFAHLGPFAKQNGITPNLGLWDQVAALKWIQQNIYGFGGDPTKVTLAGVAAGGASVNYHLISTASKGLFSKAISAGGSVLCPWAYAMEAVNHTIELIQHLGAPCDDIRNISVYEPCLKNADAYFLMKQSSQLYVYQNLPVSPFGPVFDNDFLDAEPEILFQHEKFFELSPLIFELNKREDDHAKQDIAWKIREHYYPVNDTSKKVDNHREDFSLISKDVEEEEEPADAKIEEFLRNVVVSVWGSFIDKGQPYFERPEFSEHIQFYNVLYGSEWYPGEYSVWYTEVTHEKFTTLNAYETTEMKFWNSMPIQIYEEMNDFNQFSEDEDYDVYLPDVTRPVIVEVEWDDYLHLMIYELKSARYHLQT